MGSSVGSAIPVVNMDIKQRSVGVAVKHHAPTSTSLTSKLPQDKMSNKKISKESIFSLYRVL